MSEILGDTVMRRHPEAAFRVIDGQALIVMPRDARMITLNGVGTRVWELLGDLSVAEIAGELSEEFEVSDEEAMADTITFLAQLSERGMVTTE